MRWAGTIPMAILKRCYFPATGYVQMAFHGMMGVAWLVGGRACAQFEPAQVAHSAGGMVVTASLWATHVGRNILAEGGNAVDAAVATAFALAVTWPEAGNIGGGGFMLVCPVGQEPVVVDYRETAPRRAYPTMFGPHDSRYGHQVVGVPGTVQGLALAHARFGRLPWPQLVEPSVQLARHGFIIDRYLADSLNRILAAESVKREPAYAEFRRVYGKPDGSAWQVGDRMTLPELAATLAQIRDHGAEVFYRGSVADRIVQEMQQGNGWITHEDLAAYEAITRSPIRIHYRDYTIYAPPPPSSGGICLAIMLGMLEQVPLHREHRYAPENLHLFAEVMRRAYRQRARWLGDPSFTPIPTDLYALPHIRSLVASIDPHKATPSKEIAGDIELDESPETTHFSIIDADGMAVANTYTLEASYGSRVVVRGAGFLLNSEMGDFNWFPGRTDRTGQIGTPANQIAPGKRMLSSQTPTVVFYQGKPLLITGSPGGRTITNTVLTILLNVLEFQMDLPTAVAHPRMHHQWLPDQLTIEASPLIPQETIERLQSMGHRVVVQNTPQGSAHSIWIDPHTGQRIGVADGRRGGSAQGTN